MIRLEKETGRYKVYVIDERGITNWNAKDEFMAQLVILLDENAQEGFFLGAITQFQGEYIVIFKC